jgi:MerR family transcriptional regulator, thiopeptide resistance regulator
MAMRQRGSGERRIGELARATGLTVRTLHYYEQIGLLVPSSRTESGHRLYDEAEVARLYRICLLRRLGLPLAEIGRALDDPAWSLQATIAAHLGHLDRRLEAIGRLRSRLTRLAGPVESGDGPLTDELLTTMEEMIMLDSAVQSRIMLLVYSEIGAAHDWLVRVFGLGPGRVDRDEQGRAVHGEIHAGDGVIWMHPELDDWSLASPRTVGRSTASVAIMVDDVDAHYRHALAEGAVTKGQPVDQPYGYREYSALDLEGHLWSFMKPLD